MIAFASIALLLLLIAVAIVLWPLLRHSSSAAFGRELSNLDIHRDHFADLDRDLAAGTLGAERYEQARSELERRVLDEVTAPVKTPTPVASGKTVPIVLAVFIPLAATLLYLHLGNLQGLTALPHPAADMSSITADQFKEMTANLAARMKQNPDDAQGWKMLGRAYRAMERYGEANDAYRKAVELKPQDADLLADYAESLALTAGRSLLGEPTRLLDRAFKLEPHNTKVLALAGSAAFERKDYKTAISHWRAVIEQPSVDGSLVQALQKGVEEAKARLTGKPVVVAVAGKERVTGTVSLESSLKGNAAPDDTVFVFARAVAGPRMPLAIVKIKVADLPYQFAFDDSMAMMPEMKLSKFREIIVGARVSKSGGAKPVAGDLEGSSGTIKPGLSGARVTIDKIFTGP